MLLFFWQHSLLLVCQLIVLSVNLFRFVFTDVSYNWFEVGVLDYDSHYKEYLVQKVNSAGRVVDDEGQPVVNGGLGPDGQC